MDHWQLPLAVLIVLAAGTYVLRRMWRTLRGRKAGGCGGGCGCATATPSAAPPTLISEQQLTSRLRNAGDSKPA